jgi:hypothetical protein
MDQPNHWFGQTPVGPALVPFPRAGWCSVMCSVLWVLVNHVSAGESILVPVFSLQGKQSVENKNSTGLNTTEFKLLFN